MFEAGIDGAELRGDLSQGLHLFQDEGAMIYVDTDSSRTAGEGKQELRLLRQPAEGVEQPRLIFAALAHYLYPLSTGTTVPL